MMCVFRLVSLCLAVVLLIDKTACQLTRYSSLIQYDREELSELSNINSTMIKEKKRPLEFNLELMSLAQEEAEKLAKSTTLRVPNLSKLKNKYKGYVYKIQGFTPQSYVGSVICVDNYKVPMDSQTYDVNTGCPSDLVSELLQFKHVGYGRAFDSQKNLYAVRIYSDQTSAKVVVTTPAPTKTTATSKASKKITKMSALQYEAEEIADINRIDKERIARGLKALKVDTELNFACMKLARKLALKNTLYLPKYKRIIKAENYELFTFKVLGYTKDAYVGSRMCFNSVSSTVDQRIYDMNESCTPSGINEDTYVSVSYGMDVDEEDNVFGVRLFTW